MSFTPSQNDVLFGRGTGFAIHEGNVKFRSIVEARKQEYRIAQHKEKKNIVISIIRQIQSMNPPGRFLQQDPNYKGESNVPWLEVDEDRAASKVGHCLRERPKEITATRQESEATALNPAAPPVLSLTGSCSGPLTTSQKIGKNLVPTLTRTSCQSGFGDDTTEESSALSACLQKKQSSDQVGNRSQECTKLDTTVALKTSNGVPSQHGENGGKFRENMPLRKWINDAILTIKNSSLSKNNESNAILANYYIIPSLEIALSLVNQICDAQEMIKAQGYYSYLPTSRYDWADHVIVQFPAFSNSDEEEFNLEPLALTSNNEMSLKHDECNAILSSIAQDTPFYRDGESVERRSEWAIDFSQDGLFTSCLRVNGAKLLPPISGDVGKGEAKHETQRIYMLGRVFYEIFSGGELPPEREVKQNTESTGKSFINPHRSATRINLQESLKLSDNYLSGSLYEGQQCDSNSAIKNENEKQNKKRRSHDQLNISTIVDRLDQSELSISVESLKLKGIPLSLCDLIRNMLDSASGDICGDDAYCRMVDVQKDLRFMLDKPSKFLRNPDVEMISIRGLEINDTVYGQRQEFESLQKCYWNSFSRNEEFAIIVGPSGSGKSVLAQQFCNYVVADGGIYLSGKFDQFQQSTPFSAITHAFNEYCSMLVGSAESAHATNVASALRENLGHDAFYLVDVIPNLSLIVGDNMDKSARCDFLDSQIMLQNLLCRFVMIVLMSTPKPVILFLDDLQWADQASIAVVGRLLSAKFSHFLFVGSCRDDEMGQGDPVWKMISNVQTLGLKAQIVQMTVFDEAAVNEMISDMLRLSPRLTRPLANIIHHKTKGNPLFLTSL
ncbi:hypothetical protein ACHAXS_002004 [Conticribra weissflogii]